MHSFFGHHSTVKVAAAALAALLLVAICSPAEAHLGDSGVAASSQKPDTFPNVCCFTYMHRAVPRRFITAVYTSSSMCNLPAVILVTRNGREICADPQKPWVKALLKHFQMQEQ